MYLLSLHLLSEWIQQTLNNIVWWFNRFYSEIKIYSLTISSIIQSSSRLEYNEWTTVNKHASKAAKYSQVKVNSSVMWKNASSQSTVSTQHICSMECEQAGSRNMMRDDVRDIKKDINKELFHNCS